MFPGRFCCALASAGVIACMLLVAALPAAADDHVVKVAPLGSHDGEFCGRDRALVFEDPNGTRILYDAGRTVAGPDDPRLGKIDIVLVSHMHGDHVGDQRISKTNQGTCGSPDTGVSTLPQSNTVDIAVKHNAKIVTGSEMPAFFAAKLKDAGGDPATTILLLLACAREFGAVAITTAPAAHCNALLPFCLARPLAAYLPAPAVASCV